MTRSVSHWSPVSIPTRALPSSVDVAIIGAGIAGCTTAMELHRAGVNVAVLERHSAIGSGMSSRNIAVSTLGLGDNPFRLYQGLGEERTQQILNYTHENSKWLLANQMGEQSGSLTIANNESEAAEIEQSAKILQRLNWPANVWSPQQTNQHYQSEGLHVAYEMPLDVSYNPTAFLQQCTTLEEVIFSNCTVQGISSSESLRLHTSRGILCCEFVVIATNVDSPTLDPFFSDKITPVRLQTIALSNDVQCHPAHCQFGYIQWRDTGTARLISGCRWGSPHLEIGERDDAVVSATIGQHLRRFAKQRFNLTSRPLQEWTGIMGFSCDGLPLIGPLPGAFDIIACCGFSGNQSSLGFRAAQSVARLILEGKDPALPEMFQPRRFL